MTKSEEVLFRLAISLIYDLMPVIPHSNKKERLKFILLAIGENDKIKKEDVCEN